MRIFHKSHICMEFDTNPHHCGSYMMETPTPGTRSLVETRHKEGEGVSLQQMHPRKVQLVLKSAAAANTKAPESFVLTLLPEPRNHSPPQVLFPWARTERMPSATGNAHLWGLGVLLSACPSLESMGSTNPTWSQAMDPCLWLQGTQQRTQP